MELAWVFDNEDQNSKHNNGQDHGQRKGDPKPLCICDPPTEDGGDHGGRGSERLCEPDIKGTFCLTAECGRHCHAICPNGNVRET